MSKTNRVRGLRYFGSGLFFIATFLALTPPSFGQVSSNPNFNHDATAFPLLYAHRSVECKACHLSGRYRGTPITCENCHNGQISYGKPANHILTIQTCSTCHTQNAWIPSNFTHDPSTAGQCSTCHNGQKATGKPSNHVPTTSQCDSCHNTNAWVPAGFNHATLMGQLCSSCHRMGGSGLAPRIDVVHSNLNGQDCSSCHSSTTTFTIVTMNHAGISPPTPCATCHIAGNNAGAVSTPNPHPYAAANSDCGQCHTNFSSFAGASFNHAGVTTCKTCHYAGNTTGALPPPTTAGDLIHNPLSNIITDCNTCHTLTTSGGFATMNASMSTMHTAFVSVPCTRCHESTDTTMKSIYGLTLRPANHNVGKDCSGCHNTSSFSN